MKCHCVSDQGLVLGCAIDGCEDAHRDARLVMWYALSWSCTRRAEMPADLELPRGPSFFRSV